MGIPIVANEDIVIVAVCWESPVGKEIHLVHYPLVADYLVTREWVCL